MTHSFESVRYGLGSLCAQGHDYAETGRSLRAWRVVKGVRSLGDCVACRKIDRKRRYAEDVDANKASARIWYAANKVRAAARTRASYVAHRTERLAYAAQYRASNSDKLAENKRRWYQANRDAARARSRTWYDTHRSRARATRLAWRITHADELRAWFKEYGASARGQEVRRLTRVRRRFWKGLHQGVVTVENKDRLLKLFDNCCAVCLEPLTVTARLTRSSRTWDHIVPLSMGGKDDDANILPLCLSCNATKGKKTLIGWLGWDRAKELIDVVDRAA